MNVHKNTQLTHARMNCAPKESSCDSPLPKNLILTILASSARSGSTKVIKFPHTKNDSLITHNGSKISRYLIKWNCHIQKYQTQCTTSPISLPVFSNWQLLWLTQDPKGLFKACNGDEWKCMVI